MTINQITGADVMDLARLGQRLWPAAELSQLKKEFEQMLHSDRDIAFVCRTENHLAVGFVHVALRTEFVEGTVSSPVGYLEAIYVSPAFRSQGIAQKLVALGEDWVREKGCTEFAGDVELHNRISQLFIQKAGFKEVNRIVCYTKSLK